MYLPLCNTLPAVTRQLITKTSNYVWFSLRGTVRYYDQAMVVWPGCTPDDCRKTRALLLLPSAPSPAADTRGHLHYFLNTVFSALLSVVRNTLISLLPNIVHTQVPVSTFLAGRLRSQLPPPKQYNHLLPVLLSGNIQSPRPPAPLTVQSCWALDSKVS